MRALQYAAGRVHLPGFSSTNVSDFSTVVVRELNTCTGPRQIASLVRFVMRTKYPAVAGVSPLQRDSRKWYGLFGLYMQKGGGFLLMFFYELNEISLNILTVE